MDPFAFLYEVTDRDRAPFGGRWCGPERFEYSEPALVATYPGQGDGQTAEVYCVAMPARFYRVKALPGPNSVGEPQHGYQLNTGSDEGFFAAQLAERIAGGMVALDGRAAT